ncbi:penicillin-binding protein [Alkalicoccus urumqiensis]|uniref:serine-type D-Ala-D-Ala carboxypeptidase n=1 Tax=Alkalicoccus urumqiensis TaxID=1548213 RepID=A0A2P6MGB6_ALKUR|nr:penicillin-binding protein [Alkalicoccus urumqiensis]PRO65319.1 penicillin-binding protein [Alkalicoccus urumqiensis]
MENSFKQMIVKRAVAALLVFTIGVVIIFSRFAYIQASKEVDDVHLYELLETRWTQTQDLDGKRGSITDRNGEVLAEEIPSYTITAVLDDQFESHVADPAATAAELAPALEMDEGRLEELLSRDAFQVELGAAAKNLSYEKMQEIEAMELSGIHFREDPRRYYPMQTFASHVIGYTERDMSEARMGLESSLNDYLSDTAGYIQYQQDGSGRPLASQEEIIKEPEHGDDVVLTLDARIQTAMEQTMSQVDEMFEPERMMAVAAHAETGEILAMSNRPSFNPNEYESIENYTNYAISSRFEPGSTMKIFTLAGAVEEGVYNGEATFESGSVEVYDRRIRDHNNGEGWGEITYNEGVQRSSNVAFSKIAMDQLGPENVYKYIEAFGFREPTGIDLPNEAEGGLIAESGPVDAVTTAFGQATAVTAMQQVKAASAIANDGKMVNPYVVSQILNEEGETVAENTPTVSGEPISAETATEVRDILTTVVSSENGTGQAFAIDGFEVAGKTGTAQIVGEDGRYVRGHGQNLYSFIGMAPADDPEVIVYVAVDRPDLEDHEIGSEPVSMIFRQVMEQSLQYLNIRPDEDELEHGSAEQILLPDFSGEQAESVEEELKDLGMEPVMIGDGSIVEDQSFAPETPLAAGEMVFLVTDGSPEMPDVTGWSTRELRQFADTAGVRSEVEGSGFVYAQMPPPGSSLNGAEAVQAKAAPPGEEPELEDDKEEEEEADELPEEDETFFMD